MPFEIRFYGEDPSVTLSEVRALLNLGFVVEADKGKAIKNINEIIDALPGEDRARASARAEQLAKPRKPSHKTEPKQVDLEEAIAARVASEELNDDISDVGVEPDDAGETAPPVSKDDVRTKLIELMKAKGEDAPTKLLSDHFKVSKIGELRETDYAAVVQKADEAIKAK